MKVPSVAQVIKTNINIGRIPYFERNQKGEIIEQQVEGHSLRNVIYQENRIVEQFHLICCTERLDLCLAFNLYLIERYTGEYSLRKNRDSETEKHVHTSGYLTSKKKSEGVEVEAIKTIAKDLKAFVDWIIADGCSLEEVYAVPKSYDVNSIDESKAILPIWRFQKYLTQCVESNEYSYNLANRICRHLVQFYVYLYLRGDVRNLPFSYKLRGINVKKKDGLQSFFAIPRLDSSSNYKQAIEAYISNFKIPRTAKQKKAPDGIKELQPFNSTELFHAFNSEHYTNPTCKAMINCALLAGLRDFEVISLDYSDLTNPNDTGRAIFKIQLNRKFSKTVNLTISLTLMQILWDYTQTDIYRQRRIKHETKYGVNNEKHPLPLFINKEGERMERGTPGTYIRLIRTELRAKNQFELKRTFHDLRATFATYFAIAMIKKGYKPEEIKARLIVLMSHENFDTTQKYLDFAVSGGFGKHGAMEAWVVDIYSDVYKKIEDDAKRSKRGMK